VKQKSLGTFLFMQPDEHIGIDTVSCVATLNVESCGSSTARHTLRNDSTSFCKEVLRGLWLARELLLDQFWSSRP